MAAMKVNTQLPIMLIPMSDVNHGRAACRFFGKDDGGAVSTSRIKSCRGFVKEQYFWFTHDSLSEEGPLPLATR